MSGVTPSAQSHLWQARLGLLQMAVVHSSERDYDGIMKCHGQNGRSSTQNVMIIIIIIITNTKPAYGPQGLAGGIVGPRYRYLLGCSQRLTLRLRRSARIVYVNGKGSYGNSNSDSNDTVTVTVELRYIIRKRQQ